MTTEIMGDPGPTGRFGQFGGRFVPESLVPACLELEEAFRPAWADKEFQDELDGILRPTADARPRSPSAAACPRSSACGSC